MDTSKIIKGVVNSGRYTVTAPIVKEDYGLYLQIEGIELPPTYQVDFSNSEQNGTSVTMIGNSDGVLIPHQFIDTGKDVFAFLYHVGEDFGRTVYKFRIPNKVRPDRTEDTPTPEEQSVIDQAISALNEAVEQTSADVASAGQSARSASDDADRAESAKDYAEGYASNAQLSATQASNSASSAYQNAQASAQSASQSARIKADVEDLVDDAQGYASASAQSATASANSASQASASATSASQSASSAQGYASQAQTSAQTASSKATEASGYASTASAKASEASQSATTASNKASEASGYATSASQAKTDAESARDSAQGYASDAQGYANDAQASAESVSASASQIAKNSADILKTFPTDTASGAVASFSDGADDLPLKSLVVDINPVQDLSHGDPSPENLCPISGWTEVDVEQSGVNLWDEEWELANINWSTSVFTPVTNGGRLASKNYIPVVEGNYYCNLNRSQTFLAGYTDDNGNGGRSLTVDSNTNIVTIPSDVHFIKFGIATSYYGTTYNHDISINYPSTDHSYHPYTGRSITIDLGQTVYGGKLDVLTGKLTVYPYYASYNGETLTGRWISDRDVYAVGTTPTIGAQVVNVGAQGTEIQLEPHEVASLLGQNNIFADTGDTDVEYRADTKLFIERLTAPDSADMIADANITSGQYFMVGNSLYKATANIANGSAIVVGTNCIRKSLSEALNEINA